MSELKPCPFCGGEPEICGPFDAAVGVMQGGFCVECRQCGASSPAMFPLKESVRELLAEKWNTRHDPTGPALEAAEKALKECVGMLRAYVGEVPLTDDDWTEEHGIMAQADAALALVAAWKNGVDNG